MITMNRLSIIIPASGVYVFPAAGDFVFCESASGDVTLRVYNIGEGSQLGDGMLLRKAVSHRFRRLYDQLTLNAAAGTSLTIWTGEGESNLNLISGSVTVASGGTFSASAAPPSIAAAASLDIAADSTRLEIHFQVPPTNAADLIVRDQSGTADAGILLGPNGLSFYQLSCSGATRVRNNSAGALTVRYAEVKS